MFGLHITFRIYIYDISSIRHFLYLAILYSQFANQIILLKGGTAYVFRQS